MEGTSPPTLSIGISREDLQSLTTYITKNVIAAIQQDPEAFLPSTAKDGEKLYSIKEVANKLKRSDVTIRNWCHEGKIKYLKLGGRNMMISQEQLDEFMSSSKSENYE